MANASYNRYLKGLHFLEGGETPETRGEYELARSTLNSLQSAVIGAGANTWQRAKDRYRRARRTFDAFPSPCQVTLYHVAEPCQYLGHGGACEHCEKIVKNVMHRTLQNYGIELD